MKLSAGIGITNDCNLRCAHCYRGTKEVNHLSLRQIRLAIQSLPITSIGFGTGESILNPEFVPILELLTARGISLSLASNGHTLTALADEQLQPFHDVELSVDLPDREGQDAFRGEGNWDLVHRAASRCRRLGVPVSMLATMMNVNYDKMDRLAKVAREMGVTLRVNAYQCVTTDRFRLSYRQFWEGYRRLFGSTRVINCSEPVVRAAMGIEDVRSPCGHTSIRLTPGGEVIPCVYWPAGNEVPRIEDLPRLGLQVLETEPFLKARAAPAEAAVCRCQGGCSSRRALSGSLDGHDQYCPWVRGDPAKLDWEPAPAVDLIRAGNVCTTIVAP